MAVRENIKCLYRFMSLPVVGRTMSATRAGIKEHRQGREGEEKGRGGVEMVKVTKVKEYITFH